ncbi:MAG: hypothetical protein HYR56_14465 [Acidobacteria bacterium]|nr:hypothetical protein [Acidobacteriota bacterium]
MMDEFQFLLFTIDPALARAASAAGVNGLIIDWEHFGKAARQCGADTEINHHTVDDLRRVRASTDALIVCRLNRYGVWTEAEVEAALAGGADELLLPMVRQVAEVEAVLAQVGARGRVGILVETEEAVRLSPALARLPLARVYLGLNDLAIGRGESNIFTAVIDGTLEAVRRAFRVPFGFGGLTLPEGGSPIPCRLLLGEMARLNCGFSFLRRSFHRDIRGRNLQLEVPRMRAAWQQATRRPAAVIEQERQALASAIVAARPYFERQLAAQEVRCVAES